MDRKQPDKLSVVTEKISSHFFEFKNKHPMFFFLSSRIFSMFLMLFILGLAIFGLMQLAPGDVVDNYVKNQMMNMKDFRKTDNIYTNEEIREMKKRLGLDKPFYEQYFDWLYKVVVKRDLGITLINKTPILFLIKDRLLNTLTLSIISLVFITFFSFLLGIYFSTKVGTRTDLIATVTALFFHAFPSILLLILLQTFASITSLFPVTGYPDFPFNESPVRFSFSYLYHIFLPLLGAFLGGIGGTMRMIRSTMLDQLGQPYITALRARGISENRIFYNHAFRNTMNPYITNSSTLLAGLFSGSLILEIKFSYPGIGRLMYEAVVQEDINLVLTTMLFISFLTLIGIIISDILLAVVDPRIRYGKS